MKRPTFFRLPLDDVLGGLEAALPRNAPPAHAYRALALVGLGLAAGWWLYVPVHELLHAAGCLAAGGAVERLEIAPLYGGGVLARVFPFVAAGGEYAGRLSGFDTGGSDAVYLVTVLAPYLLTLFPGVWLLRRLRGRPFLWGAVLSVALAPLISIPGDGYEVGSIVTTWTAPYSELGAVLRADDVVKLGGELRENGAGVRAWSGLVIGSVLSVLWALATYALASVVAARFGQPPPPQERPGQLPT